MLNTVSRKLTWYIKKRDQKVTVNILDPCQEESYLNDHGGNMEDCRAAWEMTLHQFELSNQADRKNRVLLLLPRVFCGFILVQKCDFICTFASMMKV